MTEENPNTHTGQQAVGPSPELRQLDRLVGTWTVSGEAGGQVTYEWMEGGFFLVQHVDLEQYGQKNKGIEIIGHERGFGATEPGMEIKSRFYDNQGNTFDYVYELEGDTLTIWGGEKGSPAYFRGTLSADGNTLTGAWVWPGGGYEATMTRVDSSFPAMLSNRSMPESIVIPELAYRDMAEAATWLCEAFGFEERLRIGNHRAQLRFDQGSVIVTQLNLDQESGSREVTSPNLQGRGDLTHSLGALTHSVMVRVKDVDRHYERAVQSGARILHPPTDYPYGERQYTAEDPGGHIWTFSQSIVDVDPTSWGGSLPGRNV